jgi:hypothetical protein
MDSYEHQSEHRKKRRRREILPRPSSARLTFDDSITSDAAILSPQLWQLLHKNKSVNGKSRIYVLHVHIANIARRQD